MRKAQLLLLLFLLPIIVFALSQNVEAQGSSSVLKVSLYNDIGLAEEVMFDDVIATAQNLNVDLILVELSTPGGAVSSVQNIMAKFANSPIPISVLIPFGGVAWSGGTYLLMASHVAAMASGSTIGSCQPVGETGPITDSKYIEAMVGLIVDHAAIHDRNTTLAEEFVTLNTNVGPAEALSKNVIEFIADNDVLLLNQLNNYMLVKNSTVNGTEFKLVQTLGGENTTGDSIWNFTAMEINSANIIPYTPSIAIWIIRFVTNPIVVSVFLTIGSFGLIIGLTTTNTHLDEIVGGIALVIGLIGVGIIGIAVGAMILFFIGLVFFLLEIKFDAGFNGALAIGGGVCIAIASLFIIPSGNYWTEPGFLVGSRWSAFGISVAFIAFLSVIAIKVLQTKFLKSDLDVDQLVGSKGYVKNELKPEGQVIVKSEQWSAIAVEGTWPIPEGEDVEVVKVDGLRLVVKPVRD